MPRSRSVLTALAAVAVVASSGALLTPAHANTAGPGLVIDEAYGGGGNTGALYKNDFVELRNTTAQAISLGGRSVQYRSAASTGAPGSSNVIPLPSVDLPAGATFLVDGAAGTGGTQDLPKPDATSSLNMGATGGQVFLADTTAALDPGTGSISNDHVL